MRRRVSNSSLRSSLALSPVAAQPEGLQSMPETQGEVSTSTGVLEAIPFTIGLWLCTWAAWKARRSTEGILSTAQMTAPGGQPDHRFHCLQNPVGGLCRRDGKRQLLDAAGPPTATGCGLSAVEAASAGLAFPVLRSRDTNPDGCLAWLHSVNELLVAQRVTPRQRNNLGGMLGAWVTRRRPRPTVPGCRLDAKGS